MTGHLFTNARVMTGSQTVHGWLLTRGAHIAEIGTGPEPAAIDRIDLGGRVLLPGFVDLHVHGGGGFDMTTSHDAIRSAVAYHRRHGTTSTLVSLVTAPVEALLAQLDRVADVTAEADSGVLGAHLEGPFLSRAQCGAQNPAHLRMPDRTLLAELVAAARGTLRVITIAPELPGALDVIDDSAGAGVVVAVGHTDATYEQTRAAIRAGATLATHLCNAMAPFDHREPGAVGAVLHSGVAYELILDGVHVHPAVSALVRHASDNQILVTDAMAASGMPDGDFDLGGQPVVVRGGEARLVRDGTLAGSTLSMNAAVRHAVRDVGWSLAETSVAASHRPARVLGKDVTIGRIAPGMRADLVVLDDDLTVAGVVVGGRWVKRLEAA